MKIALENIVSRKEQAFSLVELSIVLVILGLLTGGILTGQNLIRAAELRSILTEKDRFITATQTFKDKYLALPGDIPNATDFWGAVASCTAGATGSTGTETCSGDGNGQIGLIVELVGDTYAYEEILFWQHLANAGLIEGKYPGAGPGVAVLGQSGFPNRSSISYANQNVVTPESKAGNQVWYVDYTPAGANPKWGFAYDYGHRLYIGWLNSYPQRGKMKAEEVWSIDKKVDDGLPGSGKVLIDDFYNCTTATSFSQINSPAGLTYNLAYTTEGCGLFFAKAF